MEENNRKSMQNDENNGSKIINSITNSTVYNKLVRDKIPEVIRLDNQIPIIHFANDEEYRKKLNEKLLEEVKEYNKENNQEELADILEVIYALCDLESIDLNQLEEVRKEKLKKKGGFKDKIILERIDY